MIFSQMCSIISTKHIAEYFVVLEHGSCNIKATDSGNTKMNFITSPYSTVHLVTSSFVYTSR